MLLAPALWPGTFHNRRHGMEEENAARLKEKNVSMLTILVGEGDECEDCDASWQDVWSLTDITEVTGKDGKEIPS